jgi:hypothetical protein
MFSRHGTVDGNATTKTGAGVSREDIRNRLQHTSDRTTDGYIEETADEVRQYLIDQHRPLAFAGATVEAGATVVETVEVDGDQLSAADLRARVQAITKAMTAKTWRKCRDELLALVG